MSQIFWREYFYQLSYKNIHLGQIKNNPMAMEIPWDYNDQRNLFPKWEGVTIFIINDNIQIFFIKYLFRIKVKLPQSTTQSTKVY